MPLSFPTQPNGKTLVQNMSMRLKRVVVVAESPFTLDTQVYTHQGARWEAEVTLKPMPYEDARSVEAFIIGLKGREGTFTFGNPLHTDSANIVTSGTTAIRSETLTTSAGSTAVSAGAYFRLGTYLYMVTADKSSGAGTLEFQPPLREAIATGQALDFTQPESLWRMSSNDVSWSTNEASLQGFSFAMVEAI
jgi:hypothetical protein